MTLWTNRWLAGLVGSALAIAGLGVVVAPQAVAATYSDGTNTWTYTTSGSTASITACSPCTGAVAIPSTILVPGVPDTTYTVTSLGYQALRYKSFTSLSVPGSVTSIGEGAFQAVTGLVSVTLNSGLLTIGKEAFQGNGGLLAITIPGSVASIGQSAFKDCGTLASVVIQPGVTSIGNSAFQNDAITSIAIPDSMVSIGVAAFAGIPALTSISLGTGLQTLGDYAFLATGVTSVNIPSSVTAIGREAFSSNSALASVTLNSGLLTIGEAAFKSCALTSITIPDTVTTLGPQAFMSNSALATATLGGGLTSIGSEAFQGTLLSSIVIPNSVTTIGASAFSGLTSLVSVTLGSGVRTLGNYAFSGTRMTSVNIPSSVTAIGERAFWSNSALATARFGSGVTSLGNSAFSGDTALSSITFTGAPPTTVGTNIFLNVPAATILIPSSAGWPTPPALFAGKPTEYVSTPTPAPIPAPAPAPAPVVTPTPTPTATQTANAIPAPVEGLAPVTAAGGGALPPGDVRPGGSMLLVGGQQVPVAVIPAAGPRPTALVAAGPGFTASFGGVADDGAPLALGASGALVVQSVQQGRSATLLRARAAASSAVRRAQAATGTVASPEVPVVAASGDGFLAGSMVRFYVLPDTLMGDLVADGTGAFAGKVPVPAGIVPGARTLQMNGYAPDGSVRSLSIGIIVTPAGVKAAVSRKRASVFFEPMSARITARGMVVLRGLVRATGTDAAMTRVVGFVRATGATDNDDSLSRARAASVKAALRSLGLRGPIDDRGDGAAAQEGPAARRATVTISYRRTSRRKIAR